MKTTKENSKMIKRVQVYDMDGTIVCSLHRYRTIGDKIDLDYWRANEYRAYDDSLRELATQYKADLADPNCYVIIATARVIRDEDMRFIKDKLGMPDYIISRKDGDSISGGLLKIKGLQKFFNLRNFKNAEWTFYEDNVQYLKAVCDKFNITGVYIPSNQGH
jgi:hydroxymethylpyrimidine pyrophosphatase-like HAD family hydrolase